MRRTPAPDLIRLLLVDDHAVVRAGLRLVLARQPRLLVVGEAKTHGEALALTSREQPHVIVLDLNGDNRPELIPDLLAAAPAARVLLLTGIRDREAQYQAVRLGAMGVVRKEQPSDVLIKAIEKVHAGEAWIDRAMIAAMLADQARPRAAMATDPEEAKIAMLTQRERQVIALIGEALKNKQVAARLVISETTVRHHITSIFTKLGVADRLELVIYAYRYGLAKLPC